MTWGPVLQYELQCMSMSPLLLWMMNVCCFHFVFCCCCYCMLLFVMLFSKLCFVPACLHKFTLLTGDYITRPHAENGEITHVSAWIVTFCCLHLLLVIVTVWKISKDICYKVTHLLKEVAENTGKPYCDECSSLQIYVNFTSVNHANFCVVHKNPQLK